MPPLPSRLRPEHLKNKWSRLRRATPWRNSAYLYLSTNRDYFRELFSAISSAKHSICVEMYIVDGLIGKQLLAALQLATTRGVDVQFLYDDLGSTNFPKVAQSTEAKGQLHCLAFSPISPWKSQFRLLKIFRRNHRKSIIIDNTFWFVGGINWGDDWSPEYDNHFLDDAVRLQGDIVNDARRAFDKIWRSQLPLKSRLKLRLSRKKSGSSSTDSEHSTSSSEFRSDSNQAKLAATKALYMSQNDSLGRRQIEKQYRSCIDLAQERIWIRNPYFIPSRQLIRSLQSAAKRGVSVKLWLPANSDVAIADIASQRFFSQLLSAGVQIFLIQGPILHSKTAIFDRQQCIIGSYNFDALSRLNNLEVAALIKSKDFVQQVESSFLQMAEWQLELNQKQLQQRFFWKRLFAPLLRPFERWL